MTAAAVWFGVWLVQSWWHYAVVLLAAAAAVYLVPAITRFALVGPAGRRHYPGMLRARLRWRRLATNLNFAYLDKHKRAARSLTRPGLAGTSVTVYKGSGELGKLRFPRAKFRADEFGWSARVRLVPGVSRVELERNVDHLANAWRAHRVGISQPKPGVAVLRAMRRDPLAEPLSSDVLPRFDGRRVMLGMDEWGSRRYAGLAGLSGSVIGGSPGRGKSQCAMSLAVQLAPVPTSDWYVLDGGGGADWECWAGRATRFATDDLAEARDVVEDAHALMVKRLATVTADLGTRNAWTVGPSPDYRLVWIPVDESHQYLDLETAKALGKEAEQHVRAIRGLVGNMLRRGRKVLFHVTLMAQKCSSSSIPPDLRDLAGLRLAFGCPTTENAVAVLGDDIRTYPALSPTGLQGDEHIGVTVARLKTGADPYTRLRVPFVDERQVEDVARATSRLRLVPAAVPA